MLYCLVNMVLDVFKCLFRMRIKNLSLVMWVKNLFCVVVVLMVLK